MGWFERNCSRIIIANYTILRNHEQREAAAMADDTSGWVTIEINGQPVNTTMGWLGIQANWRE